MRLSLLWPGKHLAIALPLTAAMVLASCNKTNTPLSSAFIKQNTKDEARLKSVQRDAQRDIAMKKLKSQLNSQKAALTPPLVEPVQTAAITPVAVAKVEPVKAKPAPTQQTALLQEPEQPAVVAALPKVEKIDATSGPLGRFHGKLAALESGTRKKPVTILHIGDSHVASDSFSRGIRKGLQRRYGDAGRGMVIPANAFKYGVADQVGLSASGTWRASTALKTRKGGRFGISGVNVRSRSSRASMTLTSKTGNFDWAEVTVASGPSQGSFTVKVGSTAKTFEAFSKRKGSKTFRINARGKKVTLTPGGGAQTTVLNWATGKTRSGIRYVNFGLIGATLDITKRFDMKLVENDVRRLNPDLIIYGYGTNEGFNDNLNTSAYAKRASSYVSRLKANAPNADLVFLGAASGLRRKGNKACGSWSTPPKLGPLRTTLRKVAAKEGAGYWDWSTAMGGACAINTWAGKGLAAKDRVHLTSKGYRKSAERFVNWLTAPAKSNVLVASN